MDGHDCNTPLPTLELHLTITACERVLSVLTADFVWSDEWAEFGGHSYKYFEDLTITAERSRDACAQHGALLVSINNAEEQEFIVDNVLRRRTLSAFIGGSDMEEGSFYFCLLYM